MTLPIIVVASATANTGSKVVRLLSESGQVSIRALVRNPDAPAAQALAALPHVTLVKGDFNDPASLKPVVAGAQRAFLVSAPGEHEQYDREVNFIAAATEAGLEAVVRISTGNALIHLDSSCVYARAHARIEQYIAQHKSKVIDLQPGFFMSDLLWQAGEAAASGTITYPITAEQATAGPGFAAIDPRDVAGAAVAVLLSTPQQLAGLLAVGRLEVMGPEVIQFSDFLKAISDVTGQPLSFKHTSLEAWSELMQSFGVPKLMADSFGDSIRMHAGAKPTYRPLKHESSPELLAIWTPKYTVKQWAADNSAAFMRAPAPAPAGAPA